MEGDLDIALPSGCEDAQYLAEVELALNRIAAEFVPELVFYLAGADPYVDDRLGLLAVTKDGLRRRDDLVLRFFRSRNIPVAISMAGGYANEIVDIVDIHFATVKIASEHADPTVACGE